MLTGFITIHRWKYHWKDYLTTFRFPRFNNPMSFRKVTPFIFFLNLELTHSFKRKG